MRGIDRVIAVILLVGAVGGAAAFARHSGSDSTPRSVHLAAPPLQHVGAPETVLIDPMPAPSRVKPPAVTPARRVTTPQATLRRPIHAVQPQQRVLPPVPKPTPAPVETLQPPVQAAPATPVQPPRVLAVVPPVPPAPAPTVDVPIVLPPAEDSGGGEGGNGSDEHGNDNNGQGNDNGGDQGHGSGHDQGGGPQHSGD